MIEIEDIPLLYTTKQFIQTIPTSEYKDKYVNLETTMAACMECPNYSKNWACPEFKENVLEYWDRYDNIELTLTKIIFTKEALNNSYNEDDLMIIVENSLFRERNKLIESLEEKEAELNGKYLYAGFCGYCERCSRLDNKPCKYPDKCHNSIESIGGLVGDTLNGVFDEEIKWIDIENGKLPENLSLLMGVLY
jgi:predicted metal-binding protein